MSSVFFLTLKSFMNFGNNCFRNCGNGQKFELTQHSATEVVNRSDVAVMPRWTAPLRAALRVETGRGERLALLARVLENCKDQRSMINSPQSFTRSCPHAAPHIQLVRYLTNLY